MIEPQIQMALDHVSNNEFDKIHIEDSWIDEAGEALKGALRKQLSPRDSEFGLRMSNVGRPLCQLQMQASGAKGTRKPYNFANIMMIGDCVEIITDLMMKIANVNVTGRSDKVELQVDGTIIKGTDDVTIDHKVYDIKSASPWSFSNKWSQGYEYLKYHDDFGYVSQLHGYASAKGQEPGGWIVVCKSTGAVKVVECDASVDERRAITERIKTSVNSIVADAPFERCFEPVDDKWRGKPTGRKRLGKTCEFCDYKAQCWPNAVFKAHPDSEAKNPPQYWYLEDE